MKIVRPYAHIVVTESDAESAWPGMRRIEWAARISHRTEESQTSESWKRFIKAVVIDHGDWSVVEHTSVTVDALVDRGITHEWVRHRLFGFTQESTRFVNYEKKMPPSFIYPKPEVECEHCICEGVIWPEFSYASDKWKHGDAGPECAYEPDWLDLVNYSEVKYRRLIKKGWRPQEARSVLPNALASRIVITGNLRNWRHFLIMRTTAESHPQFRQVTIPLLAEFQDTFPILFDDITPMQKQSEAIKKAR